MDIRRMLQREDFYRIFKETYEGFLLEQYGRRVSVDYKASRSRGRYVCYDRLNIITTRIPKRSHVRYLFAEFNHRSNAVKNFALKLYVLVHVFTFGLLAHRTFDLRGDGGSGEEAMIWPCNRTIRFFDFERGVVISTLKSGFSDDYFYRALQYRASHPFSFIPPLLAQGDNWFAEPIMRGNALARVGGRRVYQEARATVAAYMCNYVYGDNPTVLPMADYRKALQSRIRDTWARAVREGYCREDHWMTEIFTFLEIWLKKCTGLMRLVNSHGDLQEGNVWVTRSGQRVYLIDWETVQPRSPWYDAAAFYGALRGVDGMGQLLKNRHTKKVQSQIFSFDRDVRDIDAVMAILFLEETEFLLSEMLTLPPQFGQTYYEKKIGYLYTLTKLGERGGWHIVTQ